jgi:serine/threonine protein kinase
MHSLRLSGSEPAPVSMPAVGDEVFGFRLRCELGRGAYASVFLAEQVELAGRPVVLKVSAASGKEPQTLAQLQHAHIVPIYSYHEDTALGLRAVCMPFFGGATLSRVLGAMGSETSQPTRGAQLVRALQSVQAPPSARFAPPPAQRRPNVKSIPRAPAVSVPSSLTPLARLEAWSYLQATAWIGARLAHGLHHAHQHGILHRDIKPSNILLSADGQPLLLDFNLSADLKDLDDPLRSTLGGTVAYMAPEHLRAMAARDPAVAPKVDHRSDIYSLGMVLYEMLVGYTPFDQSARAVPSPELIEAMAIERAKGVFSIRERRPDVPASMDRILRKCLHPDPNQRYQQADHLAADLRALVADRPLRHAPGLGTIERLLEWSRRHPRLATCAVGGTMAAALLGILGAWLAVAWSA